MSLSKEINSPQDMRAWVMSVAYHEIVNFIQLVSRHVTSKRIIKDMPTSKAIISVCDLLGQMEKMIDSFPPEEQPQRFGNVAFRSWFKWLSDNSYELCKTMLVDANNITTSVIPTITLEVLNGEIASYLLESVGNATRIDYGTGHELAFIAFLLCLFKAEILTPPMPGTKAPTNDYAACGLVVMPAYLRLVRKLQTVYRMEPAGSHGVWCLDDFQFVPFIWGASQLIGNDMYSPVTISDRQIASEAKDAYLLFSCIDYIYQVKTGPFEEHSPTLYGIGQVAFWEKVQSGLVKMYKGEVLNKFPVVQHFRFGNLLPFEKFQPSNLGSGVGRLNELGAAGAVVDKNSMHPPRAVPPHLTHPSLSSGARGAVFDSDSGLSSNTYTSTSDTTKDP
ncbi:unnamed protein product [Calicophoron daubneyi]|uniref:Serine/threonine-protein phosphatase 2A activator n=1 Tax=Calicophoron daubneyi TaxID=300641 RepID=A0AAV2T4I8_CALDB